MKLKLLVNVASIILLYSCASNSAVTVLCEKDAEDNYVLKWEIYPDQDNVPVEIFVSDNDSVFPSNPLLTFSSNDYIAIVKNDLHADVSRKYFRVKVGRTLSSVVTNRLFDLDSVQNFRDLGGYATTDNKQIRWGKIFRSGSLLRMTPHDSMELSGLKIKTVIDMRSADVKNREDNNYIQSQNIRIPIAYNGYSSISQKVLNGQLLRGDAIIYTQDTYRDMVNNFASQYADFFDVLCDAKNYPIAYHCYLGKDQTGLATYFLLRALDVPLDMIEDDYMTSAAGIDKSKFIKDADTLSESRQEAFTMLTKTDLAYLKYGISCIREKSGSVEDYMFNELRLTPEKKKKLKQILLH